MYEGKLAARCPPKPLADTSIPIREPPVSRAIQNLASPAPRASLATVWHGPTASSREIRSRSVRVTLLKESTSSGQSFP
jgi:hypothetical protein